MTGLDRLAKDQPQRLFFLIAGLVTVLRIVFLYFSEINLGPDETQYWWWAQEPAFGYFSKPPMIAWLIGATTALFGDAEWAVRLSSPIITLATSWVLFLAAGRAYDQKTALWTGLVWLTLPIITMSGFLLSTDVPLLLFWSVALYAFTRLTETPDSKGWALLMGTAAGLGMLSKYAMIYFPPGMALAFALSARARRALKPQPLLIAGGIAFLIFLPNILWNAANDFQTLDHTRANASWSGSFINPGELLEFFAAQFGVIGPILFSALLWGVVRHHKWSDAGSRERETDLLLMGFALPPLAVICFQAFISGANANWAMAAYPAAIILITSWLLRLAKTGLLKASLGLHALIAGVASAGAVNLGLLDSLGLSNSIKRIRDWDIQAAEIATYAENYSAIVVDDRELMGNLLYYLRDLEKPVYAWDVNRKVEYHYEAFDRYPADRTEPSLLVVKYPEYLFTYVEFANIMDLGATVLDTKVKCPRQYSLYEVSGYDGTKGRADIPDPGRPVSRRNGDCRPY